MINRDINVAILRLITGLDTLGLDIKGREDTGNPMPDDELSGRIYDLLDDTKFEVQQAMVKTDKHFTINQPDLFKGTKH